MYLVKWKQIVGILVTICVSCVCSADDSNLPVLVPTNGAIAEFKIRNVLTWDQMFNITGGNSTGLLLDLGDTNLYGEVCSGPYPFEAGEADYDYPRHRLMTPIEQGKGVVSLLKMHKPKYDANDWSTATPDQILTHMVHYRMNLYRAIPGKTPEHLGFYDARAAFAREENGGFVKKCTLVEGPFISLHSGQPDQVTVCWRTDEKVHGQVYLAPVLGTTKPGKGVRCGGFDLRVGDWIKFSSSKTAFEHRVEVSGLKPLGDYIYRVECTFDDQVTRTIPYRFKAAPPTDFRGRVSFGFASDSREGVLPGEQKYMGINYATLSRLAQDAARRDAHFFLFGGDLVNGYTSSRDDFSLQLRAWKQAMAGFWRSRPVWTAMGNHEALLNVFRDSDGSPVGLDKWPYATHSAEAVFNAEFINPQNGPEPANPARPTYKGNVYHVQYGPILAIAFNNNYWWTSNDRCKKYGGCPEGYMMTDQIEWIEN